MWPGLGMTARAASVAPGLDARARNPSFRLSAGCGIPAGFSLQMNERTSGCCALTAGAPGIGRVEVLVDRAGDGADQAVALVVRHVARVRLVLRDDRQHVVAARARSPAAPRSASGPRSPAWTPPAPSAGSATGRNRPSSSSSACGTSPRMRGGSRRGPRGSSPAPRRSRAGVVWPQPYAVRAASRPGVRELTRVCAKPCAAIHSLTAAPPPTSAWIHRLATLSLTVSIRNASSRERKRVAGHHVSRHVRALHVAVVAACRGTAPARPGPAAPAPPGRTA